MEWVEASGSTVAVAVEAALAELGITDREHASVEVLQEPKPGFLGMGKQPAVVKVSVKPTEKSGGRRRTRGGSRGRSDQGESREGRGGGHGNGGRGGSGSKVQKGGSEGRSTRTRRGSRKTGLRVPLAAKVSARSRRWMHRRSTRH